jgi:hypothetical protein
MRSPFYLLLLACAVYGEAPALAKSNTWWDCYYREFELCQGRARDPDAPAEGGDNAKVFCEGKARQNCEEEDLAKVIRPEGHSANEKLMRSAGQAPTASPAVTAPTPAPMSNVALANDGSASASASRYEPEGKAASGDSTVLGVDVTLPVGEVAERYAARHVHGCSPVTNSFARKLCLDSPGGEGGSAIELEFYRGRLRRLHYESRDNSVKLRAAVALAETKTGGKAALGALGRVCTARFALGGGSLALQGEVVSGEGAPCDPAGFNKADLARVDWRPALDTIREIEAAELRDSKPAAAPAAPAPKAIELEKTKAALPL